MFDLRASLSMVSNLICLPVCLPEDDVHSLQN